MWYRTQSRRGSEDFIGQPTLTENLGEVPEILGGLRGTLWH